MRGHGASVQELLQVSPNLAASRSADSTIKFWDLNRAAVARTFTEHTTPVGAFHSNEKFMVSYEDGLLLVHDLETGGVLHRVESDILAGVNPRNSIFLNEVGSLHLTPENILFTGESKKVRMWDLRQRLVQASAVAAGEQLEGEERKVPVRKSEMSKEWVNNKPVTNAFRLRLIPDLRMLVAGFRQSNGVCTFDLRKLEPLEYYNLHYYPMSQFDIGQGYLSHMGLSCAMTEKLQYDLRVVDFTRS